MPSPTTAKSSKSDKLGHASIDRVMDSMVSMKCLERLLDLKLAEIESNMATKDCTNDLKNAIVEQKNRMDELESGVTVM